MKPGPDPDPPHEEVLKMFALSPKPALAATDLDDAMEMTDEGVRKRLKKLEKCGYLKSAPAGERTQIYWLTDAGREFLAESLE